MTETRYQRIGREQREPASCPSCTHGRRTQGQEDSGPQSPAKITREAKREKKYLEALTSDHHHEMDS